MFLIPQDADPAAASEPAAGEGAELQQPLAAARRAEDPSVSVHSRWVCAFGS